MPHLLHQTLQLRLIPPDHGVKFTHIQIHKLLTLIVLPFQILLTHLALTLESRPIIDINLTKFLYMHVFTQTV